MTLPTIASCAAALERRRASSVELTRAVIEASRARGRGTPNKNPFVAIDERLALEEAAAADARRARGEVRGRLDGVPIAVKDEIDARGLPTRKGTAYLPDVACTEDSFLVARLREAGAIVVGKVHQHENGLGATGINPHAPVPRNPHHEAFAPGGSSSGSAVAVAAGLVPFAVAADGGGSIRIPASFCGVFGIKPTLGRVSRIGTGFDQGTLAMAGPIASCVEDLAQFLSVTTAIDARDEAMAIAPNVDGAAFDLSRHDDARKLRVGVIASELEGADPAVARAFESALSAMQSRIERVDVRVPLASLAREMGYVLFGVEAACSLRDDLARHRGRMGYDVRLLMALGERLSGDAYLHVQRLRRQLQRQMNDALAAVDVLALPTTACTALPVRPGAESTGEIDDVGTAKASRYTFLANVTGLPAASIPIGVDELGLPIGLQLVGAAFEEVEVLRAARSFEREGVAACPDARDRATVLP